LATRVANMLIILGYENTSVRMPTIPGQPIGLHSDQGGILIGLQSYRVVPDPYVPNIKELI